jgi:hypothetical protein
MAEDAPFVLIALRTEKRLRTIRLPCGAFPSAVPLQLVRGSRPVSLPVEKQAGDSSPIDPVHNPNTQSRALTFRWVPERDASVLVGTTYSSMTDVLSTS